MNPTFDIKADVRYLPNIIAAVTAASLAYQVSIYTLRDEKSGETVLIQDCGTCFVIAFPGTHNLRDLLRDIECKLVETTILGKTVSVHEGFDVSHRALIGQVIEAAKRMGKPVYIIGHSKGAAVAKRCALALYAILNVKIQGVITFGEPRGGDARYAALYNTVLGRLTVRITNAADPIAWLPAWLMKNRHCGIEGYLPPGEGQIVYGPKLLWKVVRNFREIVRGWLAIVELRTRPLATWESAMIWAAWESNNPLRPFLDHRISNYTGRLNEIT